jgi:hypothetical protein
VPGGVRNKQVHTDTSIRGIDLASVLVAAQPEHRDFTMLRDCGGSSDSSMQLNTGCHLLNTAVHHEDSRSSSSDELI